MSAVGDCRRCDTIHATFSFSAGFFTVCTDWVTASCIRALSSARRCPVELRLGRGPLCGLWGSSIWLARCRGPAAPCLLGHSVPGKPLSMRCAPRLEAASDARGGGTAHPVAGERTWSPSDAVGRRQHPVAWNGRGCTPGRTRRSSGTSWQASALTNWRSMTAAQAAYADFTGPRGRGRRSRHASTRSALRAMLGVAREPSAPGSLQRRRGEARRRRRTRLHEPDARRWPGEAGTPTAARLRRHVPGSPALYPSKLAWRAGRPGRHTLYIREGGGLPRPPAGRAATVRGYWPVSFRLDDSMAMLPSRRLSQFQKVIVEARISRSGQARPGRAIYM